MPLPKLLTLLSLLVLSTWSAGFTATLSCQTCSINCPYSSCYLVSGPGYQEQVCGYEPCDLTNNITRTLDSCSYSYNGKVCSTGVCFHLPTQGCVNYIGLTVCSSTPAFYASTCASCTTPSANCAKCTEFQTNAGSYQTCLGLSCNGAITFNTTIASCAGGKDYIGNSCPCCYSSDSSLEGKLGQCTTESLFWASADFNTYAKKQITSTATNNTTTGSFENRLFICLLVLCGLLMALL